MNQTRLSFKEYAKHRGCTPGAVTRAIKKGRISAEKDPETGERYIDPIIADPQWDKRTNHSANQPKTKSKPSQPDFPIHTNDDGDDEGGGHDYWASRAKRESYNAELARLTLEEKEASLVLAEDVKKEAYKIGRVLRESLMALPDRLAATLAAEDDPKGIEKTLRIELRDALKELTGGEVA